MDADGDLDEDVVAGLGFDLELGLLDHEVDEVDALGEGDEEVEAGAGDAIEFAEALDDAGGGGADLVVGLDDEDEEEERDDREGDEGERGVGHGGSPGVGEGYTLQRQLQRQGP